MHPYVVETFSPEERALLRPHVSNLDQPVFALLDLPEVVKGALFARYSRSPASLRRLLIDEFAGDLPAGDSRAERVTATRAAAMYGRVFDQYGDDSVAQLGGAHVAVEQASNLLTKVLERGRLAAYLEQSTRYMRYDDQPGGRYRYFRDPDIMASPHAGAYEAELDAVFATYGQLFEQLTVWAQARYPQDAATSPRAHARAVSAKVCDLLRGMLPAATVSNVGIFASGQSYESLLLRLLEHELAEARHVGQLLLTELREVIPSFLTRVDRPERGGAWANYLATTRAQARTVAAELLDQIAADAPETPADGVTLVECSPDADLELVVGILYPHSHLSESQLRTAVLAMSDDARSRVITAWVGQRGNRRHKPGRALERIWYRFDICGDYGAFRDLQRHRMLTIDWQELSPRHGYAVAEELVEAGVDAQYRSAMDRQAGLWERLRPEFPRQAAYAVGFGYRIRYSMQLNARAAMQLLELRTAPQGHPSYRRICQRMHQLIATQAGQPGIAALMSFVDHSGSDLERLAAEQAAEQRRVAATAQ